MGVKRTFRRMAINYYWPSMLADVEHSLSTCEICQREKAMRHRLDEGVAAPPMEAPLRLFELWSMDFIGPLKPSEDFVYILTIIEHFSGWLIAIPVMNPTANTVMKILQDEVISRFGVPRRILSDRGSSFRNADLAAYFQRLGIRPLYTSAYHPASNGKVERANGVIKTMLKSLTQDPSLGDNWNSLLQPAIFAYNTSPSERTGYSPFFLVHGVEAVTPGDMLAVVANLDDDRIVAHPQADLDQVAVSIMAAEKIEALRLARDLVKHTHQKLVNEKIAEWKANARVPSFEEGDLVLVQDKSTQDRRDKARLGKAIFVGPYRVKRRINAVSYQVQALDRNRQPKSAVDATFTVHLSRLRSFKDRATADPLPSTREKLKSGATIQSQPDTAEEPHQSVHTDPSPHPMEEDGPSDSSYGALSGISEGKSPAAPLHWPVSTSETRRDVEGGEVPLEEYPSEEESKEESPSLPLSLSTAASPPADSQSAGEGPAASARSRHAKSRQPFYGEATLSKLAPAHDLYRNYSLPSWISRPPVSAPLNPSLPPGV
jgi:transposase InsO family protein